MAQDQGRPSGDNKSEGVGAPKGGKINEDLQRDQELTDKYTDGDGGIADHLREINPNRNVDKTDATNAGGYKN